MKRTQKTVKKEIIISQNLNDMIAYVNAGNFRKQVIQILVKNPLTLRNIGRILKKDQSQVYRCVVNDLIPNGLVECVTPMIKQGKLYELTKIGNQVYDKLLDYGYIKGQNNKDQQVLNEWVES